MSSDKQRVALVGLDGTLADNSIRFDLAFNGEERRHAECWKDYDGLIGSAMVDRQVLDLIRTWRLAHIQTVIVTRRQSHIHRRVTEQWLERNGVPYLELVMMPQTGELSEKSNFKYRIFQEYLRPRYLVAHLADRDKPTKKLLRPYIPDIVEI